MRPCFYSSTQIQLALLLDDARNGRCVRMDDGRCDDGRCCGDALRFKVGDFDARLTRVINTIRFN